MKQMKYFFTILMALGFISAASASTEILNYNAALVEQDITADNVEDHLDNLTVAFLQNREDLLNKMDTADNELDEEEFNVIVAYLPRMTDYEVAALKAVLDVRQAKTGNKHALMQVRNALDLKK